MIGTVEQQAAAFVSEHVTPNIDAWEQAARYPRDTIAGSGLTGLFCPAELGGAGLGYPAGMAVFEQLGRGDAALAFSLSMHNAVAAAVAGGDPALRERWAERLVAGEALGGFSLTEPHAGSDATALQCRFDPVSATVTGRKAWVSLAGEADLFLVACRTGDGPGTSDIALVAVARDQPGVRFPTLYRTPAGRFLPIGEMELRGAAATVLAPPGAGMRAALGAIDVARCDIAAIAAGVQAHALDVAVSYAKARTAFGGNLLDLQGVAFPLADAATDLEASRVLYGRAADLLGTRAGTLACAHAKRFAADAAVRTAIACSQTLGAYGWLDDHGLTRCLTLAKMLQVVDGTSEIQRVVIARALARS